jgi:hypothetical protein
MRMEEFKWAEIAWEMGKSIRAGSIMAKEVRRVISSVIRSSAERAHRRPSEVLSDFGRPVVVE